MQAIPLSNSGSFPVPRWRVGRIAPVSRWRAGRIAPVSRWRAGRIAPVSHTRKKPKQPQQYPQRAGEGTRTLDIQLGKLALYQLSYARRKHEFSRFLVRNCPVEFIQHPHKTLAERPKSKSRQIWAKDLGQRKSKKRYDEGPVRSSNRPRTRKLYRRPVP